MIRKFIAAFVLSFFVMSSSAFAAEEPKLDVKPGEVYQATGVGGAPSNWDQRDSFAKTFARQAARMDALRQLVENFGLHVNSTVTLDPDEKVLSDYVKVTLSQDSKVFKLLEKNARQVGDVKFSFNDDGKLYCEVTMKLVVPADWKN